MLTHKLPPCKTAVGSWNRVNLKKVSRLYRTIEVVDADDDYVIR